MTPDQTPDLPDPVGAALRATLAERADDVTWDPRLVTAAVAGVQPRRIPPAVAWLSAAAAAVLVVGGVSVVAGGGTAQVQPARTRSFVLPVAPTTGYVPEWTSCEQAWARGAIQATDSPAPFVRFRPAAPATSYVPSLPGASTAVEPPPGTVVTNDLRTVPPGTSPSGSLTVDGPGSSTVVPGPTSTGDASPGFTGDPVPPTLTGDPSPAATLEQRYPTTQAETTAYGLLTQVLDTGRFAGLSVGPGRDVLTVHVVRGPTQRAARALVESCAMRGVRLRTDLVTWSDGQLGAIASDVFAAYQSASASAAAAGAPEPWRAGLAVVMAETNYDLNRTVLYVGSRLTADARAGLRDRYGDSIAVVSYADGEVWKPSAP